MVQNLIVGPHTIFNYFFEEPILPLSYTKLVMSTPYHSQTDGQIEHIYQCLDMYMQVPLVDLWYNSSFLSLDGLSSFQSIIYYLYGYIDLKCPFKKEKEKKV